MGLAVKFYGFWTTTIATCELVSSMSELEVSKLVNGRDSPMDDYNPAESSSLFSLVTINRVFFSTWRE
jgi:hypothetical protein